MQFIRTEPDGIRIVWKFCPGQYGLGQNGMIFIILSRLPNEMSWIYFGQLKGGIFLKKMCLICFDLMADLKTKVYVGLLKGHTADFINALSSLSQVGRAFFFSYIRKTIKD